MPQDICKIHSNTQADRLVAALSEPGLELSTVAVRSDLAIGNPADVAMNLNRKWRSAGDPRRVFCDTRTIENRYGQTTRLGYWRLTTVENDQEAANDERGQ